MWEQLIFVHRNILSGRYSEQKRKGKSRKFTLFFLLLVLFSSSSLNASDMSDLAYQGTHILTYGALDELSKVFEKRYAKRMFIKGGGCTDGIVAVTKKGFDMGGVCCPLNQDMQRQNNLIPHKVAIDIKAVIVNPSNQISNITLKELSGIHLGSISNWRNVGGTDRPIALIYRDHCRNMSEPVRDILGIKRLSAKAIVVQTDKEVVEYVERFPAAIGITSRVFAEGAKVKIIKVDGIEPTPENVEKGFYRLRGDLYLVTKGRPSGWTKTFLEFVLSPEGQAIIGKKFGRVR